MIERISHDEAAAILEAGEDARLACIVDGEPYIVPVHYVLEGNSAYLHSLPGTKIDAMRRHGRVCLQVQTISGEYHWRSVQAFGRYDEIVDAEEQERVYGLLFKKYPRLTPADAVRRWGHTSAAAIVFRVVIDRVVGVGEG